MLSSHMMHHIPASNHFCFLPMQIKLHGPQTKIKIFTKKKSRFYSSKKIQKFNPKDQPSTLIQEPTQIGSRSIHGTDPIPTVCANRCTITVKTTDEQASKHCAQLRQDTMTVYASTASTTQPTKKSITDKIGNNSKIKKPNLETANQPLTTCNQDRIYSEPP